MFPPEPAVGEQLELAQGNDGEGGVIGAPKDRVTDFGVAPGDVLRRDSDDELTDVCWLARSARLAALSGTIVLLGGELAEPVQDRRRANELTARFSLLGRQCPARDGQPAGG